MSDNVHITRDLPQTCFSKLLREKKKQRNSKYQFSVRILEILGSATSETKIGAQTAYALCPYNTQSF